MSQYRTGTITVTNGSATVTGVGTEFLANVSIGDDIVARDPALSPNEIAAYIAGGVVDDNTITLTAPYGGPDATDIPYVAHRDYLANGNPKWANGDVEFAAIQNRYNSATTPVSGFGSAAFVDVGSDPLNVPRNSDLPDFKTAAEKDTGTTPGTIPLNDSLQLASSNFLAYGGTADAIELTTPYATPRTALIVGETLTFLATSANTGAATLKVDAMTTLDCRTITGKVLPAGYIRTDVPTNWFYDGTYAVLHRDVESGGDSDGNWVRLENGVQTCCQRVVNSLAINLGHIGGFRSDAETWEYPVPFSTLKTAQATDSNLSSFGVVTRNSTETELEYIFLSVSTQTAANRQVDLTADGTWYD